MPFKSKSQRAACYAKQDPNWDCKKWDEYEMRPNKKLTFRERDNMPDSSFLLPEYRKLPFKDGHGNLSLSHVRNALARANQVRGVPKWKIRDAINRARHILAEHGGYQHTDPTPISLARNGTEEEMYSKKLRKNFWKSKPKSPEEIAREEEERAFEEMRSSSVWRDKFRYWNISEGRPRAEAEQLADESYKEYWDRKRSTAGKDVAFMRNERRMSKQEAQDLSTRLVHRGYDPYDIEIRRHPDGGPGWIVDALNSDTGRWESYETKGYRQPTLVHNKRGASGTGGLSKAEARSLANRLYNRGYEDVEIIRDPDGGSGYVIQALDPETNSWHEFSTKDYTTPTLVHNKRKGARRGRSLRR